MCNIRELPPFACPLAKMQCVLNEEVEQTDQLTEKLAAEVERLENREQTPAEPKPVMLDGKIFKPEGR